MGAQESGQLRCPVAYLLARLLADDQDVGQVPRLRGTVRRIGDEVAIQPHPTGLAGKLGEKRIAHRSGHGEGGALPR